MIVHFDEQPLRFQIGYHAAARIEPIQPSVWSRRGAHLPVFGHHVDLRKLVPLPHFEIVGIVRRSYFHRSGAEFAIHDKSSAMMGISRFISGSKTFLPTRCR